MCGEQQESQVFFVLCLPFPHPPQHTMLDLLQGHADLLQGFGIGDDGVDLADEALDILGGLSQERGLGIGGRHRFAELLEKQGVLRQPLHGLDQVYEHGSNGQ